MNKKIKIISASMLILTTICVAVGIVNGAQSSEKIFASVCTKHNGNHYTALAPTDEDSGTKEYYICCDCHTVILGTEHIEGDGTWAEAGVAGKVDCSHRAYDARFHSLFGKFSNKDYWEDLKLTQNPSKTSEYMMLSIGLTKGDQFVVRMDGNNWYHYDDVKSGCKSLVSNDDGNIVVNATGVYDIYCDTQYDNGYIWINKIDTSEPRIVGNFSDPAWNYDNGIALSLSGNTYSAEIEVGIGTEIKIYNGTNWYDNWDQSGNENKNAFVYACATVLGGGNARFNVDGAFKISFEKGTNPSLFIEKVSVDSPYKMVETDGSITVPSDLIYKPIKGDSSKVVYYRNNQVFGTGEYIQIKYNGKLQLFGLGTNTDKTKFIHYDEVGHSYILVPSKVSTYHDVYLFLNTSDLSLTVDIVETI